MNQYGGVIGCHHCPRFLEDEILEQVLMALCLASNKELFSTQKERHLLYKPNRKTAHLCSDIYTECAVNAGIIFVKQISKAVKRLF